MIRPSNSSDFDEIYAIINDSASAYKGVIPSDRWHEPYMSKEQLQAEMADGIEFFCSCEDGQIEGVMGFQEKSDVNLIRHAYVRTNIRNRGIGGLLLEHLREFSKKPILIGTWADASWAIRFYEKHDFQIVIGTEKDQLLKRYWTIPERQVETSVVLKEHGYCFTSLSFEATTDHSGLT